MKLLSILSRSRGSYNNVHTLLDETPILINIRINIILFICVIYLFIYLFIYVCYFFLQNCSYYTLLLTWTSAILKAKRGYSPLLDVRQKHLIKRPVLL